MYCESKGIIHRDIKPANLFVDRFGNYKVGDFGASKRMETVHVAQTMTGIGTISYMAPEIFRGQSYNNTVDIYALGLVLYQLLNNGRMAFLPDSGAYTTQDIDSANYHRLHGTPVPSLAGKYVGGERIDSRLDAAVRKACAMNPSDRYRTAKEFYDALALTEMPEKKAEPEYGWRTQSSTQQTDPSQGRQEYRKPEPEIKYQSGSTAQGRQQERQRTQAEAGPSAAAQRQASTPPPVRSYQSQPKKNGLPSGSKSVIAIVLVCIIAAVALTVLVSQRGGTESSAGVDQGVVVETEGNDSEEENTVDDSESDTEVTDTVNEEETVRGTISDSWEEIIAAGKDGTYIDKYQIGDTKELDLGEEGVIEMELVAFDEDELADGSGKANMTWIAKNLLNTEHVMNEEGTNEGGWPASDMRAWLHDSILPMIPDTVRSNIKEVKKYSYSYSDKGTISSSDKIWIPSRREVSGEDNNYEDSGPEYLTAFSDAASRKKRRAGEPYLWWLRSASNYNDYLFFYVNYDGSGWYHDGAYYYYGVAVGFCL